MKTKKVLSSLLLTVLLFGTAFNVSANTDMSSVSSGQAETQTENGTEQIEIETMQTENGAEQIEIETMQTENGAEQIETEAAQAETGTAELKNIRCAKNLREVYKAVEKYQWSNEYLCVDYEASGTDLAVSDSAANVTKASAVAADHSEVNTRDANVDEADFVRTDGDYLYILSRTGDLSIVSADGKDSSVISATACPIDKTAQETDPELSDEDDEDLAFTGEAKELFVDGDCLNILCSQTFSGYVSWGGLEETWRTVGKTVVLTYDISDRSQPELKGIYSQDGGYLQARKIDDVIYLFSRYDPFIGDSYEESALSVNAGGEELPASSMIIPDTVTDSSYLVVSSMRTDDPSRMIDAKAYVSGADQFYASGNSIYVINSNTETYYESTELARFRYEDGQIEPVAAARLKGYCNDSFSIDEDKGYVRILTTYFGSTAGAVKRFLADMLGLEYYDEDYWTRHNALYILDDQLNYVSSLQGIAKNEEVRSARFFGDTVYFVTYENTDPLFAADLSDPLHPEMLGELAVTGFSSYLHPYGDGKLLGMGYESDPETGTVYGVKLSMFDISDPENVTETDRIVIDGITSCAAIENYKCILADGDKNVIGFFQDNRYFVYRWTEENGFERVLLYDLYEDSFNQTEYAYDSSVRGLYAGNEFYVAGEKFVAAFDMNAGFLKDMVLELCVQ